MSPTKETKIDTKELHRRITAAHPNNGEWIVCHEVPETTGGSKAPR